MWVYRQSSGALDYNGAILGFGYSGAGRGKNNAGMQNVPNVGPIPAGAYTIGAPEDTAKHGPHAMRLTPDAANEMFGRSEFLMHGDSLERPGAASEGCIIMPRDVREKVSASGDNQLEVWA